MNQALQHEHVVAAAPYVRFTGLAEKGSKLKAIEVRGVDPAYEQAVSSMSDFIDPEAWQNFYSGQQQVILGRGVANELKVQVGDYVTLMIPQTVARIKFKRQTCARQSGGLLTLNGQIDHSLALVPLADAQQYARLGDGVTGISLKPMMFLMRLLSFEKSATL